MVEHNEGRRIRGGWGSVIGKAMDWIGARAGACVLALAGVAAANVLIQLWMHRTTPLTAWKGGGFGMYTEPHADARSVWAAFAGEGGTAYLRLWPEDPRLAGWRKSVSTRSADFLSRQVWLAERFRYNPRDGQARTMTENLARVRFPGTVVEGVQPANGKTFASDAITLHVLENAYDIPGAQVARVPVYSFGAEELQ